MIFNDRDPYSYTHAMDRGYVGNANPEFESGYTGAANLERPIAAAGQEPILTVNEIGQTVTEGRAGGGTFIESMQAAIFKGAGSVELSAVPAGAEPGTGVESYGVEKRQQLREIARANEIKIASVHTPSQIGNLSGFAGPERGFVDEQREVFLNEVKKAINFAADVTGGGAVVVHTGEYQRPISEQPWARDEYGRLVFKHYEEEPERAIMRVVDDRTGQVIHHLRKNQEIYRPVWQKADKDYEYVDEKTGETIKVKKDVDYVDYEGRKVGIENRVPVYDESTGRFKVEKLTWDDFVSEAEERNKYNPERKITPELAMLHASIETQAGQARGWALYHGMHMKEHLDNLEKLKEAYNRYKAMEDATPEDEKWKIMRSVSKDITHLGVIPSENKLPSEVINEAITQTRHYIEHIKEGSVGYEQQAKEQELFKLHAMPIGEYAKKKTMQSYAEAGIYALDQTKTRHLAKPVFLAPEQVFPEHGYGSHPEEMIELVQTARQEMTRRLVQERGFSKEEAKKAAQEHIKATLDTEHIGMWKRYYVKQEGESEEQFTKRFNGWYMDQIKKMDEAGIIGHVHIADGFGYGHANLPAGHGDMPVVDAIQYLKKKGYSGALLSEGYGDQTRMLRETWKTFGSPIYGATGPVRPGGPTRWSDVQHSYFGRGQGPYYVFGAYSPSNDWTLWTQVPLE